MKSAVKTYLQISSLVLAAAASPLLFSGCSSTAKVENKATSVSVGRELQDLEEARSKGLLTEDEYQKKRAEIMKRK